jgi:hypothetical protein
METTSAEVKLTPEAQAERNRITKIIQEECLYWSENNSDLPDAVMLMLGAMGCGANILMGVLMGTSIEDYKKSVAARPKGELHDDIP